MDINERLQTEELGNTLENEVAQREKNYPVCLIENLVNVLKACLENHGLKDEIEEIEKVLRQENWCPGIPRTKYFRRDFITRAYAVAKACCEKYELEKSCKTVDATKSLTKI